MVDKKGITAWISRQVKESVGCPDVNISVGYLKDWLSSRGMKVEVKVVLNEDVTHNTQDVS